MKALDVGGATIVRKVKAAAAAVAQQLRPAPAARRPRDPFYSDNERREAIGGDASWVGRRKGWLR